MSEKSILFVLSVRLALAAARTARADETDCLLMSCSPQVYATSRIRPLTDQPGEPLGYVFGRFSVICVANVIIQRRWLLRPLRRGHSWAEGPSRKRLSLPS
jgi:hypothetical protein